MPPSRETKQVSFVLRISDPSANAAEVAAKNDRVGLDAVVPPDVDGNALAVSDDHENRL